MFVIRRVAVASLLAVLAAGPSVGLSSTAHAQSTVDVENARKLFREALALSKDKRWDEAIPVYERSLALKEEPITLYSLGVAYKNVDRPAEALEYLRQFLAKASNPKTEPFQRSARDAVAELETQVAHVTIHVQPAGLDGVVVEADGRTVPGAALGLPRLSNPGTSTITASAPGHHSASESVSVDSGGTAEVTLTLEPLPEEPSTAMNVSPSHGADRPQDDEPFPVVPVVLMGAGVATIGAGVTVGLLGYADARDAPSRDGEEADAARRQMMIGDIVAGVGGAVGLAGAVWLIVELTTGGGSDEPADTVGLVPWSDGLVGGARLTF